MQINGKKINFSIRGVYTLLVNNSYVHYLTKATSLEQLKSTIGLINATIFIDKNGSTIKFPQMRQSVLNILRRMLKLKPLKRIKVSSTFIISVLDHYVKTLILCLCDKILSIYDLVYLLYDIATFKLFLLYLNPRVRQFCFHVIVIYYMLGFFNVMAQILISAYFGLFPWISNIIEYYHLIGDEKGTPLNIPPSRDLLDMGDSGASEPNDPSGNSGHNHTSYVPIHNEIRSSQSRDNVLLNRTPSPDRDVFTDLISTRSRQVECKTAIDGLVDIHDVKYANPSTRAHLVKKAMSPEHFEAFYDKNRFCKRSIKLSLYTGFTPSEIDLRETFSNLGFALRPNEFRILDASHKAVTFNEISASYQLIRVLSATQVLDYMTNVQFWENKFCFLKNKQGLTVFFQASDFYRGVPFRVGPIVYPISMADLDAEIQEFRDLYNMNNFPETHTHRGLRLHNIRLFPVDRISPNDYCNYYHYLLDGFSKKMLLNRPASEDDLENFYLLQDKLLGRYPLSCFYVTPGRLLMMDSRLIDPLFLKALSGAFNIVDYYSDEFFKREQYVPAHPYHFGPNVEQYSREIHLSPGYAVYKGRGIPLGYVIYKNDYIPLSMGYAAYNKEDTILLKHVLKDDVS